MTNYLAQYLNTALWSSTEDEIPLDYRFDISDISIDSVIEQEAELDKFIERAAQAVPNLFNDYDITSIAHDFWLTRNGHGAGFWDGDYEKGIGNVLTKLAEEFGEVNAYVGDNGKIYIE